MCYSSDDTANGSPTEDRTRNYGLGNRRDLHFHYRAKTGALGYVVIQNWMYFVLSPNRKPEPRY